VRTISMVVLFLGTFALPYTVSAQSTPQITGVFKLVSGPDIYDESWIKKGLYTIIKHNGKGGYHIRVNCKFEAKNFVCPKSKFDDEYSTLKFDAENGTFHYDNKYREDKETSYYVNTIDNSILEQRNHIGRFIYVRVSRR
jgi:hypothetical protein